MGEFVRRPTRVFDIQSLVGRDELRPHHANFGKRVVKSPKLYFYDTGLLCWLLGIQEAGQLATHPLRGNIFETFVVSELVKTRLNRGARAAFHFWRDSNGNEVDIIADAGMKLIPIEIKSGQTLNREFFVGLERWLALAGDETVAPALVYGGTETHVRTGINVFGWNAVGKVLPFESFARIIHDRFYCNRMPACHCGVWRHRSDGEWPVRWGGDLHGAANAAVGSRGDGCSRGLFVNGVCVGCRVTCG